MELQDIFLKFEDFFFNFEKFLNLMNNLSSLILLWKFLGFFGIFSNYWKFDKFINSKILSFLVKNFEFDDSLSDL